MSDTIKDGGPAFPVLEYFKGADGNIHPEPTIQSGMSLRDWFAGRIAARFAEPLLMNGQKSAGVTREMQLHQISSDSYAIADAMLAEREKGKP